MASSATSRRSSARLPNVRLRLGLGGIDEPLRFDPGRLDELSLFVGGFLERLFPDRGCFGVGTAQTGRILFLLPCRFGPRRLGFLQ